MPSDRRLWTPDLAWQVDNLQKVECGRKYYQTPVIETSSTGVSENPAINIAHFRHSEVHWPRLASTLSFNSVQPWFVGQVHRLSLPVVILHQAPFWIPAGSCPLPGFLPLSYLRWAQTQPKAPLQHTTPRLKPFSGCVSKLNNCLIHPNAFHTCVATYLPFSNTSQAKMFIPISCSFLAIQLNLYQYL